MNAVLYVCHGSRVMEGCKQAIEFVQKIQKRVSVPIQEISFLELAMPTIEEGFAQCIKKGATEIVVIPVFLLAASHVKNDIPKKLKLMKTCYPNVQISFGNPFGVHERMIDILLDRIEEKGTNVEAKIAILLVGRGSTDPDTIDNFEEIINLFHSKTNYSYVKKCFLAAADPLFEEILEDTLSRNVDFIIVIPYLLFTGRLVKGMKKTILSMSADKEIILCDYLGFHPYLEEILVERVNETVEQRGIPRCHPAT
ncbi:sirohydrochlorin chelatase [Rossellomorea sp. BNER]|uniref:sirohydrochlorin chelatase n=1 Tax=Rossellomorea sp. BNER TaxID=2962031 RepID=UPI003AF21D5B|nr:sirohydrochlorin chelatase [Rossellomorea sp. BNER]